MIMLKNNQKNKDKNKKEYREFQHRMNGLQFEKAFHE